MIIYDLVVSDNQNVLMLYGTNRDDDEPNVIYHGALDPNGIQIDRAFEMHDVQSICVLPDHFDADFLAMDGSGGLLWLGETHESDQIAGACHDGNSSKHLGRLSQLETRGGSVFALGYGAQVYRCDSPETGWTFCAEGLAALVADEDEISLSSVMVDPESQSVYVAGTVVGGMAPDAEAAIDAANEAGDAAALAELILANLKSDRGGLWRGSDGWEEITLPMENSVIELFDLPTATVVLGSEANILSGKRESFKCMNDVRPEGYLKGFCRFENRVLLSFSESLFTFDGEAFVRFADAPFPGEFHRLAVTPIGLVAACKKKVLHLNDGSWRAVKVKGTRRQRIVIE